MISNGHAISADTTHGETLQQRRPLTRRTLATIVTVGLSIFTKGLFVFLELLPAYVAGMRVEENRVPLIAWQLLDTDTTIVAA